MESINIGTFTLVSYNDNNNKHRALAGMLEEDDNFKKYVGVFKELSKQVNYDQRKGRYSRIYFAYIGSEVIGMMGVIWPRKLPELVLGILPKYRGHHYSKSLCEEYSEYVFKNYQEYNSLYARICPDNIHSIENALEAGFEHKHKFSKMYVKKRGQ